MVQILYNKKMCIKHNKLKINILFIVIIMFLGLSTANTIFADSINWVYVNKAWYALDDIGMLIHNKWVVYNNEEYHLSLDGTMDTNKWIDSIYYVDSSGKKMRNCFTPDGYYVNQYGVYDSSIPRYSNINNQYSNMPITPADITISPSAVINATGIASSAISPPINNNSYLPNNKQISDSNNNYGFHLTTIGYNEDNNYYGRHSQRAQYKTIMVELTYNNQYSYLLNNTRLEQINDALETVCDDFERDAIDALERDSIKKYYINKAELTKFSYTNIVITFSGYMTTYDNYKSNLKYRFTYYPYDEYYTLEEIY